MKSEIIEAFPVSTEEYQDLDREFGKLCYFAAHKLKQKNSRNNITDDVDDIYQDLQICMMSAAAYFKRQVYIERCLSALKQVAMDSFSRRLVEELSYLWDNRTRHGANRQKFGPYQESLLETMICRWIPPVCRPDKGARLEISRKFSNYCKAIIWNGEKAMGKKITREKAIRNSSVSLSVYEYLGGE